MNCLCQPGQLAVKRETKKNTGNFGREFFACASGKCGFFQWADSKIPVTLHTRTAPSSSSFRPGTSFNPTAPQYPSAANKGQPTPQNAPNLPVAKMTIISIENNTAYVGLTCPSSAALTNFMQRHPDTCTFDFQRKMWTYDLRMYDDIVHFLRENGYQPEELPRFLSDGIRKYFAKMQKPTGTIQQRSANENLPSTSNSQYGTYHTSAEGIVDRGSDQLGAKLNISASLRSILLPFQFEGVEFIINHGGRGLIGDEMGCGKTVQAVALLQHYRTQWPALIIVPANLLPQWKEELLKYCHDCLSAADICSVKTGKDTLRGKITLMPYTLVDKFMDGEQLLSERFGMIIADESHKLKNRDSKLASNIIPLLKQIPIAICLSGTPMLNRPVELYTQLNGLLPIIFYDFHAFIYRYCDGKQDALGFLDKKGASNQSELKLLLEKFVMIRRLKEQVITELPDKKRERLYVDVDQAYAAEIHRIRKTNDYLDQEMKNPMKDAEEKKKLSQQREQSLLEYYRVTGLIKIGGIKKELLRLIEAARIQRAIAESADKEEDDDEEYDDDGGDDDLLLEQVEKNEEKNERKIQTKEEVADVVDSSCQKVKKERKQPKIKGEVPIKEKRRKKDEEKTVSSDAEILVDTEDENESESYSWLDESNSEYLNDTADDDNTEDGEFNYRKRKSTRQSNQRRKSPRQHASASASCVDLTEEGDEECENPNDNEDSEEYEFEEEKPTKPRTDKANLARIQETFFTLKDEKIPKKAKILLSNKILVFAHHLDVLSAIEDVLREAQVGYIRVDGSTSKKRKETLIRQFQTDDETDVALLSITACGTGLNLTRANVAVFAEMYWSPGINCQAEDRIHRMGQTSNEVKIIYILARETADDIVWQQTEKKSSTIGATIGNAERSRYTHSNNQFSGKENQKKHQQTLEKFVGSSQPFSTGTIGIKPQDVDHPANCTTSTTTATMQDIYQTTDQLSDNLCQELVLKEALSFATQDKTSLIGSTQHGDVGFNAEARSIPQSHLTLRPQFDAVGFQALGSKPDYEKAEDRVYPCVEPIQSEVARVPVLPFSRQAANLPPEAKVYNSWQRTPNSAIEDKTPNFTITEDARARAERNRLEAQKKLAATRERERLEKLKQQSL